MLELKDKVVLVTGASSGIGKAIVERLVAEGSTVIGCARSLDKLEGIRKCLNNKGPGQMYAFKCDVSKEDEILNMFTYIEEEFGCLDIVINNAGILETESILSGRTKLWMEMLQVNVMAVAICCREAVKMMHKNNSQHGHVININSMGGKKISTTGIFHFYDATKFMVTALSEGLRQELRAKKSHIRVTSIFPGRTRTGILDKTLADDLKLLENLWSQFENMKPSDIAESAVYALTAPPRVDVSEILIGPTDSDH